jgi:hypothetical protein
MSGWICARVMVMAGCFFRKQRGVAASPERFSDMYCEPLTTLDRCALHCCHVMRRIWSHIV